jgi:hypothetical protein
MPLVRKTMNARRLMVIAASGAVVGALVSAGPAGARPTAAPKPPALHAHVVTAPDGQAGETFGTAVAVSGDTMVVGAIADVDSGAGAAYVYRRSASGWGQMKLVATLEPSQATNGEQFGSGVAIDGSTIVVSAPNAQIGAETEQGAVYVFTEPAAGWSGTRHPAAQLTAIDGQGGDALGDLGAAISGNEIAAGAWNRHGTSVGEGAVYVWVKPKHGWSGSHKSSAELLLPHPQPHDFLGYGQIGISGGMVAAASDGADVGSNGDQGQAFVWVRPKSGWSGVLHPAATLRARDGQAGDNFGYTSLAVSGTTVVIGGSRHAVKSHAEQGAVYVFERPRHGWSGLRYQSAELVASDGVAGDQLGEQGVAISGRTVAAPAPSRTVGTATDAGAIYEFTEPKHGWSGTRTQSAEVTAPDAATNDNLGLNAIGLDGTTVVAGSPDHAVGGMTDQGEAYVFAASRPVLTALKESRKSWRPQPRAASLNPAHKPKQVATKFSFGLAQAGTVTVRFIRHVDGHRKPAGSLTVAAPQGHNVLYFFGRLGAKRLPHHGRYSASFTTANSAGTSTSHSLRFTVT